MSDHRDVVIDAGSDQMKAGFSGYDAPTAVFPTVAIQYPKAVVVGDEAWAKRGVVNLVRPMEHGLVRDWELMNHTLEHTFRELKISSASEHAILVAEHPLVPNKEREKWAEILLETFRVPAICLQNRASLSLLAAGRATGVAIEMGHDATFVVPVRESVSIPKATLSLPIGGKNLTLFLSKLLAEQVPAAFKVGEHMDVVRQIKEQLCDVSLKLDPANEKMLHFELPDGNKLAVAESVCQRCTETLFQPKLMPGMDEDDTSTQQGQLVGLPELIQDAISKCDGQKELNQNIILAGGNSMFPGLKERLQHDLTFNNDGADYRVFALPERKYLSWIGGSIAAFLTHFRENNFLGKKEYDEAGPSIIHRKF